MKRPVSDFVSQKEKQKFQTRVNDVNVVRSRLSLMLGTRLSFKNSQRHVARW